jgi:cobalt/nickel transport system permease protein
MQGSHEDHIRAMLPGAATDAHSGWLPQSLDVRGPGRRRRAILVRRPARVKSALHARLIPLISLFAAFSFVIMMFNLPLPGGTTGHAVGMGVAAIVLGPWASILAISIALTIQAVFFGDGGITALGANCFNMAIVGSLVGYATYRLIAWRAALGSARRVVAAGLAGYTAINVAALCAAIEFGIQPLLFHDASGTPLYAPYPLRIAIPAMMLGHLTLAGLAELVISSGHGRLSAAHRSGAAAPDRAGRPARGRTGPAGRATIRLPTARKLWLALAALLILTPLGILAVGSAWGEWSARDFADPQVRREIAAASRNLAPPPAAPRGLERLSSIWTAPLSRYAPSFIRGASFGYLVSAMVGVGLIIVLALLLNWLLALRPPAVGRPAAKVSSKRPPAVCWKPPGKPSSPRTWPPLPASCSIWTRA